MQFIVCVRAWECIKNMWKNWKTKSRLESAAVRACFLSTSVCVPPRWSPSLCNLALLWMPEYTLSAYPPQPCPNCGQKMTNKSIELKNGQITENSWYSDTVYRCPDALNYKINQLLLLLNCWKKPANLCFLSAHTSSLNSLTSSPLSNNSNMHLIRKVPKVAPGGGEEFVWLTALAFRQRRRQCGDCAARSVRREWIWRHLLAYKNEWHIANYLSHTQ